MIVDLEERDWSRAVHLEAAGRRPALQLVFNNEFHFVAVGAEFGGIHGFSVGREGAEFSGDLGAEAVAEVVSAAWEELDEERYFLIAEFHICTEAVGVVAGLDIDRFHAGGFPIFEHEVFVIVFAIDPEGDFNEVAAFDFVAGFQFDALIDRAFLINRLARGIHGIDDFLIGDEFVVGAVDFDFESGLGDEIFQGEVFDVGIRVERAGAGFADLDVVFASSEDVACDDGGVIEGEEIVFGDLDGFEGFAIEKDFDFQVRIAFFGGFEVIADRLDAVSGVAGGIPVSAVAAVVDEVFH